MTIISTTAHPASRIQFAGTETDLGVKDTVMSLWPNLEIARWRMSDSGDVAFPVAVGFDLTSIVANPGSTHTLWTDGTALYFGATVINNGSGADLTGSVTTTQVPYGVGPNTVAGSSGFVFSSAANQLQLLSSSASLPAYSFVGDTNTGLYNVAADSLGLSTGGTLRVTVNTTAVTSTLPFLGAAGSNTAPSISFAGDSNTGLYNVGADDLGFTIGGTLRVDISTSAVTSTVPVLNAAGSAGAPSVSFSGDSNTGLYNISADVLGLATGGVLRLGISTSAIVNMLIGIFPASTTGAASIRLSHGVAPTSPVDGDMWTTTAGVFAQINGGTVGPFGTGGTPGGSDTQVQFNDGGSAFGGDAGFIYDKTNDQVQVSPDSAALPSYSFVGDANTGMYGVSADNLGFATGGTLRVNISTTVLTSALPFRGADGSNTAPSISFSSDTNTGLYSVGADDLGITVGGALRVDVSTAAITSTIPLLAAAGSAAAPSLSFSGDPDTGVYSVGANDLGFAAGGTLRVDISSTAMTSTVPFLGEDGDASAPSMSFTSDPDTGLYSVGANDLGITVGGTLRLDISSTAVTSTLPILAAAGSAAAPSISFSGDSNTGLYNVSADDLGFTVGGTLRADISATAITSTVPYLAAAGSAGTPSFSFAGDPDTGVYSVGANDLGLTVAGTLRLDISTTALTSTLIGIFPASTAGASGYASVRLPHGAAPTTNLTDGDVWTTSAGMFVRINGATQGLGTISGTAASTEIAIGNGASSITHSSTFTISGTAMQAVSSSVDATVQIDAINSAASGTSTLASVFAGNSATIRANLFSYGPANASTVAGITAGNSVALGATGGPTDVFYGSLDGLGTPTVRFVTAGAGVFSYTTTGITSTVPFLGLGGSAGAPSISFSADPDTGMYNVGSDHLGFTVGGTLKLDITTSIATFATDVLISGILAGFLADVVLVSGTTLMLSAAHQGRVVRFTSASSVAVSMPGTLPIGFSCTLTQDGAGVVTTSGSGGGTVNNRQSFFATAGQYAVASLVVLANAGGSSAIATLAGDLA